MSFDDKILALSRRIPNVLPKLKNEGITKSTLVVPFIEALGYDMRDPDEVYPEFPADVCESKGERVDYAILKGGKPIILIECKKAGTKLNTVNKNQLFRYFMDVEARIAILTNGVHYQFFTDSDAPNKMDSRPFLELDLLHPRDILLTEVRKLCKESFNIDRMLSTAKQLKYTAEVKKILNAQFDSPASKFVQFFFRELVPEKGKHFRGKIVDEFTDCVKESLRQVIYERVEDRLDQMQAALQHEKEASHKESVETDARQLETGRADSTDIVTTAEELEGYHIVKAIVAEVVDPERVEYRDKKYYMAVLLDDNRLKTICKFWFNDDPKYLGLYDSNEQIGPKGLRTEARVEISSTRDIYKYAKELRGIATCYAER